MAISFWLGLVAGPALGHEGHAHDACLPGEVCDQAANLGAWGMIGLGLLFWLVAVIPSQGPDEIGARRGLPLLSGLQARMDKETSGWRRLQWPLLGFVFIALGVATLIGWG